MITFFFVFNHCQADIFKLGYLLLFMIVLVYIFYHPLHSDKNAVIGKSSKFYTILAIYTALVLVIKFTYVFSVDILGIRPWNNQDGLRIIGLRINFDESLRQVFFPHLVIFMISVLGSRYSSHCQERSSEIMDDTSSIITEDGHLIMDEAHLLVVM